MDNKKKKKWLKFRHKVVHAILRYPIHLLCILKYGIKVTKYRDDKGKRPYLILYNHQTAFDQFFVGAAFDRPIYYLATEDIFSNGWVSSLIKYLVEPIPIKKQTTDIKAILNCMRVGKEGGSIAIAPEGNRTYSGETVYMSPAIASLARKLGMPIMLYRIEGGYGVQPRWSDVTRRGRMRSYVSRVIEPEEYREMSDAELAELIKSELYVNEARVDGEYRSKHLAEYLERTIYYCPDCGLTELYTDGDIIECKKCGKTVRYLPTKEMVGVNCKFPYRFVLDWYNAQSDYMNQFDLSPYYDTPLYEDSAEVKEVIPSERKIPYGHSHVKLYGDRVELSLKDGGLTCRFDDCSTITVLGRNKLNIYHGGKIYQLKDDKRFGALKYVHIYNRYKNMIKGDENVKFLGL